ncbi:restriction endonuclease subunit S [Vibrio sp. 10N.261.51.A4]|uniref:restriction endonuclease subunit S n=1 Tax=Vibrio sp. 10N.261.51.A4 TaxID=3229674 RepID=UPI003551FD3F
MGSELKKWSSEEWVDTNWGELVELRYGKGLKDYKHKTDGFPVYGTNGPVGFTEAPLCPFPSVIIGRKGAYRGVHFSNKPFYVIDTAYFVEPKFDLNMKWVYFQLLTQDINALDSGSAIPSTRREDVYALSVKVPPRNVQNLIVQQLSSFNNKITLNNQINQTLEQMAQTLFKSWFVDFDPVKAKMNGEQPKGMDVTTASLFPEKLVESELGLIPKGWEASCMGEHFKITMGQSPKGETYNEDGEGIAFFQGRRDFGFRYPDVRVYTTDPKRYAKAGDTLISVRAPVGDKNMASIDCCIGRGIGAIKHNSDSRSFTYAFMSHIEKKLGDNGSSGTLFNSINLKELKKVPFITPSQELVEAFHNLVEPIDQKIEVLSKEIDSLSQLRDTLLPKLLSGEVDLENLPVEQAKALAE